MHTVNFTDYQHTRIQLIEQLEVGELDKVGFIRANHSLYQNRQVNEPRKIASFEHGIFFYQYYNTMAKYHQLMYRETKYDDVFAAIAHRQQSELHYQTKERVTYRLLSDLADEPICAYYVMSRSKKLRCKLVEIVYTAREKVILHSLDQQVIALLKGRKCLKKGTHPSLIDTYINTPY